MIVEITCESNLFLFILRAHSDSLGIKAKAPKVPG